jgi:hypothetical protein
VFALNVTSGASKSRIKVVKVVINRILVNSIYKTNH